MKEIVENGFVIVMRIEIESLVFEEYLRKREKRVRERKIAEGMEKETVDCVLLFECNELKIITFLWILVWEFI